MVKRRVEACAGGRRLAQRSAAQHTPVGGMQSFAVILEKAERMSEIRSFASIRV